MSSVSPSMTRVTLRSTQRPADRGHADGSGSGGGGGDDGGGGSGCGCGGVGSVIKEDGEFGRLVMATAAAIRITETAIEMRTVERRRKGIDIRMVLGFHEPSSCIHLHRAPSGVDVTDALRRRVYWMA